MSKRVYRHGEVLPPGRGKDNDNWRPPKDYVSAPAGTTSRPAPAPPSYTFIHDAFLQEVLGRAVTRTFNPDPDGSGALGTRRADHYDEATRTIYEINTSPWTQVSDDKIRHKIEQVSKDFELIRRGEIAASRWVGDHPLPDTGMAGQLKRVLEQCGIPYEVRQRTPVAGV
ncbi:MAG TPA: hypothetical protein VFO85_19660 [Vicinamibacteria bacterium]|nr:hypothetical protein [Vicinamibacteria bacterium]